MDDGNNSMKPTLSERLRATIRTRFTAIAAIGAVSLAGLLAQPVVADASDQSSLDAWSSQIWSSARSGWTPNAWSQLSDLPEESGTVAEREYASAIERFNAHLAKSEERRAERIAEAHETLAESIESDDLFEALRAAVEIHTLSKNQLGNVLEQEPPSMKPPRRKPPVNGSMRTATTTG